MTLKTSLKLASLKLKKAKIKTAELDTEVLFSFVLKKPKEFLYTHPEKEITKKQSKKIDDLIKKREKGWPIAYLRNLKEFYGLEFYVDRRVLIPRPETELLVETILTISPKPKTIADIGTGSGCISISLAKNLPSTKIFAIDISKPALKVAKINTKKHQAKVEFHQGDLLQPLKNKKISLIVANLPYLDNYYKTSKDPGLKFEPKTALKGYQHGLAVYEKLFKQIAGLKQQPKTILCELGPTQAKKMKSLAKKYLPKYQAEIKKDLTGLNRMIILK